jgi:NADP-dependent 3-hydroxy acid dehydrogenase YdfG
VVGLGHAVRKELQSSGIRVALIEPGLVDTPLTRGSPVVRPLVEAGGALLPTDVADAVTWLLSRPRRVAVSELVIRPASVADIEQL